MKLRSLLALALGPLALACSLGIDDVSTDESAHTEDRPTYAQYKWLWPDETEAEFRANAAVANEWNGLPTEFLPVDDPMAQRLQFWVDTMDEALRARVPGQLRATPKPHIILVKGDEPNAWVTHIPVTWKVKTRLAGPQGVVDGGAPGVDGGVDGGAPDVDGGAPDEAAANAVELLTSGKVTSADARTGMPLERTFDERSLAELVKYYNEGFARCHLEVSAGEVVFGEGCEVDASLKTDHFGALRYSATAKWITVSTGMVTSVLDEHQLVAIVAHELGHYYRAHASQPSDILNYFYALGDVNKPEPPAPASTYLEQTLKVREKLRDFVWWEKFEEENALMTDRRLGFYTDEQEADEIGIEILARIGLPPTLGPDSQAHLHRVVEDTGFAQPEGAIHWDRCAILRDRGFKDDNGQSVSIPVGNFDDPHHSSCFRVFNMVREIEAHKYLLAGERPIPPGGDWAKLLQQLQNASASPTPPPPPQDGGAGDGG